MSANNRDEWSAYSPSTSILVFLLVLTGLSFPSGITANGVTDRLGWNDAEHRATEILKPINRYFIENRGQAEISVRYYSRGNPSVAFRDDGVMVVLQQQKNDGREVARDLLNYRILFGEQAVVESQAYMIHFEGSNFVTPIGKSRLSFNSNFIVRNDLDRWRTDVPNYGEVAYFNLYDGIDLLFRAVPSGVKYEFIVHPGANPEKIVMVYDGVKTMGIDDSGIVVHTIYGDVRDSKPYAYQHGGREVGCTLIMHSVFSYGFECQRWSISEPLIIDPLIYSTYLGGAGYDSSTDMAVDLSGSAYVLGVTSSSDFPVTPGSFDTTYNNVDCFVAKLNPSGSSLVYSTFLGGDAMDVCWSIDIDSSGNAYVAGETTSIDFPTTPGAFDNTINASFIDAFVTKLNATGSGLVYSTFLGGDDGADDALSIVVDSNGNTFVTGSTNSRDFPTTPGALATTNNGFTDVFVTKLNAGGSGLVYSTYLGGSDGENGFGIVLDALGDAFVTGWTDSGDFPTTPGSFDVTYDGGPPSAPHDVFVTKLNAAGSALVYSTFLGGGGMDEGQSIALDAYGCAYVTGFTESVDFPITLGSLDDTLGGNEDAFVTKLNPSGSGLVYSTYLGGTDVDQAGEIVVDSAANAYVVGGTASNDFPVSPGAFDATLNGSADAFVTEVNPTGSAILYSTFLGGSGFDGAGSIDVDSNGNVYVAGATDSNDFPVTPGAFGAVYGGGGDTFVIKIGTLFLPEMADLALAPPGISFNPSGAVVAGSSVTINATVHNVGRVNASGVGVRFYDGVPPIAPQIGSDQVIPFIKNLDGTGVASIIWFAVPPGIHEICVVADPDNLIAEINETNNMACKQIEVLFSLQLVPGHRFMSFPVEVADVDTGEVLSSIAGCYDYVRWYDPLDSLDHWKSYVPGRAYNDLTRLDNTMGFWINITATCSFTPVGTRPVSTTIDLRQGWNMVGFPSFKTTCTVADLKADIGLAGVIVEAFDVGAAPYYLQRVSDSYVMMAGEGCWIYVPSDAIWIIGG